jgi:hypothetical protein
VNQTATGIINSVSSRTVKTQRGDAPIYDVETSVGKMSTFKREVAESAHSLKGQAAQIEFEIRQNGTYTNYTLHGVLPSTNPVAQAQLAQANGATSFLADAAGVPHTGPEAKDLYIWRQCAAKVAARLDPKSPSDFWASCQALTAYFETGRIPQSAQEQAVLSEFEQAGATQYQGDDDIPF